MIQSTNWNGNELITFECKINGEVQWVFLGRQVVEALQYKDNYSTVIKGNAKTKAKVSDNNYGTIPRKELLELIGDSPTRFEIAQRGEIVVTELGVYELIMKSDMPQAEEFQQWVFRTLKQLRQSAGLKQYEAFRMMDKDVQKSVNQILAEVGDLKNAMTNNIVGNKKVNLILSQELWGFEKEINKNEMEKYCKEMLIDRQEVLKKYADYLISCDGSHTKAEECTRKWVRFKYGHIIHKLAN